MSSFVATQLTPTRGTIALAVGAAIVAGQFNYPAFELPYQIDQAGRTFSSFIEPLGRVVYPNEAFVETIASVFSSFAERQEPLGAEFEAAIFANIEELYEA